MLKLAQEPEVRECATQGLKRQEISTESQPSVELFLMGLDLVIG